MPSSTSPPRYERRQPYPRAQPTRNAGCAVLERAESKMRKRVAITALVAIILITLIQFGAPFLFG